MNDAPFSAEAGGLVDDVPDAGYVYDADDQHQNNCTTLKQLGNFEGNSGAKE